jgi:hypothetical protein
MVRANKLLPIVWLDCSRAYTLSYTLINCIFLSRFFQYAFTVPHFPNFDPTKRTQQRSQFIYAEMLIRRAPFVIHLVSSHCIRAKYDNPLRSHHAMAAVRGPLGTMECWRIPWKSWSPPLYIIFRTVLIKVRPPCRL